MAKGGALEQTIHEILGAIKPTREDFVCRLHVLEDLQIIVNSLENLRVATVEPFGSFVSNMFSRWGDLDITVMVSSSLHILFYGKKQKQALLEEIFRILKKEGGVRSLRYVSDARVPILKLGYGNPAIRCDISINNLQGQMKSKFLYWINLIDGRFRDMVLLVKQWAKAQHINNPKFGTLNSYSLSLLVIFHFQTCAPPILPPIKELYMSNVADDLIGARSEAERRIEETCRSNIARFKSDALRSVNRSSLSDLFVSFLKKFSDIKVKAKRFGICPFTGRWEEIEKNTRWLPRTYALFIEDPFQQPENTARAVNHGNLGRITVAILATLETIHRPNSGYDLACNLGGAHVAKLVTGLPVGMAISTPRHGRIEHRLPEGDEEPQEHSSAKGRKAVNGKKGVSNHVSKVMWKQRNVK